MNGQRLAGLNFGRALCPVLPGFCMCVESFGASLEPHVVSANRSLVFLRCLNERVVWKIVHATDSIDRPNSRPKAYLRPVEPHNTSANKPLAFPSAYKPHKSSIRRSGLPTRAGKSYPKKQLRPFDPAMHASASCTKPNTIKPSCYYAEGFVLIRMSYKHLRVPNGPREIGFVVSFVADHDLN